MKFITFFKQGKTAQGVLTDKNTIRVINGDMFAEYSLTNEQLVIDEVSILTPVVPSKVICVGLNYRKHAHELKMAIPENPILFMKPTTSILPHKGEIVYPPQSQQVDYEAELAVVIKKDCKGVSRENAQEVIFGYTCLNDVTARDLQKKDGQWTRAKSFDTFCPIGPCIETEIDHRRVAVRSYLNGELRQNGNTEDLIFSVEKLVEFISGIMTLNRGDVIATGTPMGVGAMKRGDEIVIEVEGIGKLVNFVK